MAVKVEDTKKVEHLFGHWQEALIWSCLQKVMGAVYADRPDDPRSAAAVLGDFTFFAGQPDSELVSWQSENGRRDFMILVPQSQEWENMLMDCYGSRAKRSVRYAIKKEADVFDRGRLLEAVHSLKPEYSLRMIDRELYDQCLSEPWSRDLVSQYEDYGMYERLGLGVAALKDGIPVSGASSYASYKGGIEIEIDTREDHRRKGLAYGCGARLILECLERGLYPSWDAHNKWSAALAEKLGYHFDREYPVVEINL